MIRRGLPYASVSSSPQIQNADIISAALACLTINEILTMPPVSTLVLTSSFAVRFTVPGMAADQKPLRLRRIKDSLESIFVEVSVWRQIWVHHSLVETNRKSVKRRNLRRRHRQTACAKGKQGIPVRYRALQRNIAVRLGSIGHEEP